MQKKRLVQAAALIVTFGVVGDAHAQWVVAEPALQALSTTNVELTLHAMGVQAEELAQAVEVVAQVTAVLDSINRGLAVARSVQRAYQMIRNYSWEQLQKDAKIALYNALPELANAEREWNYLRENGKTMANGTFWRRRTHKDVLADNLLKSAASYAYKAGVMAIADPDAKEPELTATDLYVQQHFSRAHLIKWRAKQNFFANLQGMKLARLIKDAESKDQTDLKIEATDAAANHQTAVSTQFLRDAKASEIAEREKARTIREELDAAMRKEIQENDEWLLDIGRLD